MAESSAELPKRVPSHFDLTQIREAAEKAIAHECLHVEPERQARAKADPKMGGLLCRVCAEHRQAGFMLDQLLRRLEQSEDDSHDCTESKEYRALEDLYFRTKERVPLPADDVEAMKQAHADWVTEGEHANSFREAFNAGFVACARRGMKQALPSEDEPD